MVVFDFDFNGKVLWDRWWLDLLFPGLNSCMLSH